MVFQFYKDVYVRISTKVYKSSSPIPSNASLRTDVPFSSFRKKTAANVRAVVNLCCCLQRCARNLTGGVAAVVVMVAVVDVHEDAELGVEDVDSDAPRDVLASCSSSLPQLFLLSWRNSSSTIACSDTDMSIACWLVMVIQRRVCFDIRYSKDNCSCVG